MKYRPHIAGWTLDEAMQHMVELPDRAALIAHLNWELEWCKYAVQDEDVQVRRYGYDERLHWGETYIVLLKNKQLGFGWFFGAGSEPDYFGAVGFTDGPC